jgi:ribonuclease P protein component
VSAEAEPARIGRLVRSADFERVLRQRSRLQSPHFALHHLATTPAPFQRGPVGAADRELSTAGEPMLVLSVDDLRCDDLDRRLSAVTERPVESTEKALPDRLWLGAVVPKRHARRAVTRTLLKRQIHAAVASRATALPAGLWVVRLRAGFERASFPSAASAALRRAARTELDGLLERCTAAASAVRSTAADS